MSVIVVAALPLVAIAAWVTWRALRGQPVRRFAINVVVGVALLLYFAITAGLGIFWVANQELPAFDLHYLFGYLTLLLVVAHVWINAPLLARFVRRAAPSLAASGQRFRPGVAWTARALGLVAFGGLCFWIGWSRGASVVRIELGAPGAVSAAGGELLEQVVHEDGRALPLSRWYHQRSAHSRRTVIARGPRVDWDHPPSPWESYPALATVALPRAAPVTMATGPALAAAAALPDALGPGVAPVTVAALATLLHLTQGVTDVSGPPGKPFHKRAAASSGALYPTVTHVVVGEVDGLEPGLYHFAPRDHALHLLRRGDVRAELAAASAHGALIRAAPLTVVLSTLCGRSSWKYGERGYRYCTLDAGHALANLQAAGAGLGLASRAVGRFDDGRVAATLGVDLARQGPMVVVPMGAARADAAASAAEPGFAPATAVPVRADVPDAVRLMAARTGLVLAGSPAAPRAVPPPLLAPRALPGDAPVVALPPPSGDGDALGAVIERRRSERRFGGAPLTLTELASVVDRARGGGVLAQRPLRLHVVAIRVAGLAPGVYEHRAAERALIQVRAGDVRDATYELALSQEVVERAAAVVVLSADVAAMAWPDGSRGFRYAWIDAGVAAGRMYLAAVAHGLGVSSVGAFFDDELVELLDVDGARELPVLLVALGPRP